MVSYDIANEVGAAPVTVPVCVACGNRNTFLLNTAHQIVKLTPDQVSTLTRLQGVICGRCGSHNATILEYDA